MKKREKWWIQFRLLFFKHGIQAAKYLKKKKIFACFGDNCAWHSKKVPSEPELVSIGNNVHISSNVSLITHDIISDMLWKNERYNDNKILWKTGKISIDNDVVICANAVILYDVHISSNVIVAAGAVVTKDIPSGEIWGGVPAKKIGLVDDIVTKRVIHNENINRHK